jgi:hypothetical protein
MSFSWEAAALPALQVDVLREPARIDLHISSEVINTPISDAYSDNIPLMFRRSDVCDKLIQKFKQVLDEGEDF